MEATRLMIVDDYAPFREGLRAMLRSEGDIEVVGEAASGDEAILLASRQQPDVILMDLQMPGVNGIEATQTILETSPHINILVLSMFEDDNSVFAALQAGAKGYLLKGALKSDIVRAIRGVSRGEAIFGPAIARRLMVYFGGLKQNAATTTTTTPAAASAKMPLFPELTEREQEVLHLIAQQLTNSEIAERLTLSPKTVRNHVSNIFSKLQVASRTQAIMRVRDSGWHPD